MVHLLVNLIVGYYNIGIEQRFSNEQLVNQEIFQDFTFHIALTSDTRSLLLNKHLLDFRF